MRRHLAAGCLLLGALALGCAAAVGPAPVRLSELPSSDDPARRASLGLCMSGLDADAAGRADAALGQYQRAIQVDPNNPWAYLSLARHEVDHGDPQRAAQYLDRARALMPREVVESPRVGAHLAGLRGAALEAGGSDGRRDLDLARQLAPDVWGDGRLTADELR